MPCASLPGYRRSFRDLPAARQESLVMAEEKTGRKPDKEGGLGTENAGPETAEASPRSKRMAYTCWNDAAPNYVEPNWEWFTCWRCGALVYTS